MSDSLFRLLGAGEAAGWSSGASQMFQGAGSIMGLDFLAKGKFGSDYGSMFFNMSQNADGSYQVSDASHNTTQNLYATDATGLQVNYTVSNGPADGTSQLTTVQLVNSDGFLQTLTVSGLASIAATNISITVGNNAALNLSGNSNSLFAGSGSHIGLLTGSIGNFFFMWNC